MFYEISFSRGCSVSLYFVISRPVHRTVGPSIAAFLEPLVQHPNAASLSLFYGYYFGRYSSELAELVPFPYSHGRSTCYSDRLHDISVTMPRCFRYSLILKSFFPHKARLWDSLPIKCFPLIYNPNRFKPRISWHLLSATTF